MTLVNCQSIFPDESRPQPHIPATKQSVAIPAIGRTVRRRVEAENWARSKLGSLFCCSNEPAGTPGSIIADWGKARRADRYRVFKQIVGTDPDFVHVATERRKKSRLSATGDQ